MNENKLKRLISLFEESDLDEMEIQSFWRGLRVRLARNAPQQQVPISVVEPSPVRSAAPAPEEATATGTAAAEAAADEEFHMVVSPMVGTVYVSSSPEEAPFVLPGDQVVLGQTLCIIEAMKIMNEIDADVNGEVVGILVDNGDPVEYNQPLLQIRPT